MAKLLHTHDVNGYPETDRRSSTYPTAKEALTAAAREVGVLQRVAATVPAVAPRVFGHGQLSNAYCVIMDDAGDQLPLSYATDLDYQCVTVQVERPWKMSVFCLFADKHARRDRIRNMYGSLHAVGVVHGDVEWRHILRKDDRLFIIDYDRALVQEESEEDGVWDRWTARELADVQTMFRYMSELAADGYDQLL